jgi:phosphoglucomutase/phosphomannomutase
LAAACAELQDRYGEPGAAAAGRLRLWASGTLPFTYPETLARLCAPEHGALLFDSFRRVLPFGTGGRRGPVGYGPNRINTTTIAMTVQGHCEHLKRRFAGHGEISVVVANDVRVFRDVSGRYSSLGDHPLFGLSSRDLAKLACGVYAANGIAAYFVEPDNPLAILGTPELSFSIGELGAAGGVIVSASHNPPDDNGIKVYDEHGSQPAPPDDQALLDVMSGTEPLAPMPFEAALEQGLVRPLPARAHERYVRSYVELFDGFSRPSREPVLVYTPLCGSGLDSVGAVLDALGFAVRVPPDQGPDGSFEAIPFRAPNPEIPSATDPARAFADSIGAGIVLSSDPDADRVGLEARLPGGRWYHFDGNQIAAILLYALALDPTGPRRRGLVLETLVTSKLVRRIAELAGVPVIDDLLVGFKYVAAVLESLAGSGRYGDVLGAPSDLLLAAEEAHGIAVLAAIRDKDSTGACMFLAALYQRLEREGRSLLDYYVEILERTGGYDSVNRSIMLSGPDGAARRDRIMQWLRASRSSTFGNSVVTAFLDHWDERRYGPFSSESDRLARNLIEVHTESFGVVVRPSGTEPKLKFYCHFVGSAPPAGGNAEQRLAVLRDAAELAARRIYGELLGALDISLSEPALHLPDLVDIDQKVAFDRDIVPELGARLGRATLDQLLSWLRNAAAPLVPGADPLPALKPAVARSCDGWLGAEPEHAQAQALRELRGWARTD